MRYCLRLARANTHATCRYADAVGLPSGPTEDLGAVLRALGSASVGTVNASRKLLRLYRDGALGRFCLDDLPLAADS